MIRASDGTLYHGHLVILGMFTKFFSTALASGRFSESQNRTITLPEHDPGAVKIMMNFFYTGLYELETPQNTLSMKECIWKPFAVYKLADYVIIPELKCLAMKPIVRWFKAFSGIGAGEDVREKLWRVYIMKFVEDVYLCTNSGENHQTLRTMLINSLCECIEVGYNVELLEPMIRNDNDFSMDFAKCLAKIVGSGGKVEKNA